MYPYLHFGPLVLGTYGLMMAAAFLCAWKVLELNIRRHQLRMPSAELIILLLAVAGIAGSKLYHELETPRELLADPVRLLHLTRGYAWFGGFCAGVSVLCLIARHYRVSMMALMDLTAAPAALAYAIGRLGCLLSGDGCYGVPTSLPWGMSFTHGTLPTSDYVHPTPLYEFMIGTVIFLYLWRRADRRPTGSIFSRYLLLTGTARFLVEFIRSNPRSFFGLTTAQVVSLTCVIAGTWLFRKSLYLNRDRLDWYRWQI